jgi:hypothetical protein
MFTLEPSFDGNSLVVTNIQNIKFHKICNETNIALAGIFRHFTSNTRPLYLYFSQSENCEFPFTVYLVEKGTMFKMKVTHAEFMKNRATEINGCPLKIKTKAVTSASLCAGSGFRLGYFVRSALNCADDTTLKKRTFPRSF